MLVLSRKEGESIEISGGILLQVVEIRGTHVRLGITAPPTVRILRTELNERAPHGRESAES